MNDIKSRSILINLIRSLKDNDSWCGETHIQKAMYLLKEVAKVETNFDFILYKHGPFSFDLRDELTSMRADGILSIQSNFPYGHSFNISDIGELFIEKMPRLDEDELKKIKFIAQTVGSRNVASLERLATALYVTSDKPVENRAETINKIKPHISISEAEEAIGEIDRLLQKRL